MVAIKFAIRSIVVIGAVDANNHLFQHRDQFYATASTNDNLKIIANDIMATEMSMQNFPRSSHNCWMSSIAALNQWRNAEEHDFFTSGSAFCAAMTEEQHRMLAFEMTSCQFAILQKNMFSVESQVGTLSHHTSNEDHGAQETSVCHNAGHRDTSMIYQTSSCIPLLSEYAGIIYNQMLLHTYNLCTQLTEQHFQLRKEETTQLMVQASSNLVHQIQSVFEGSASIITQLNEMRKTEIEEAYQFMKERNEEADRFRNEQREDAGRLRQEQMIELQMLQEIIASTNSQIKPLSRIDAYVKLATGGLAIFTSILSFIVSLNVVWLLCFLPIFSRSRNSLFVVLIIGFLVELVTIRNAERWMLLGYSEIDLIGMVQYWTRALGIIAFVISSLLSCFRPPTVKAVQDSMQMDFLLRNQMELMAQLDASSKINTIGMESKARIQNGRNERRYESGTKFYGKRSLKPPNYSDVVLTRKPVVTPPEVAKAYKRESHSSNQIRRKRLQNTVDFLKQIQREQNDDNCGDDLLSSRGSESKAPPRTSTNKDRKRKFADTFDQASGEVLFSTLREGDSVSSVSSESSCNDSHGNVETNPKKQKDIIY